MKELKSDKLDALIVASLHLNVAKEAEEFLNLDVSGIQDDPRMKSKILRSVNSRRRNSWISVLRIAAVSCLLVISVIFTACMCISGVRESMWNAFVEWYEDYINVHFEENNDKETGTANSENCTDIQGSVSGIEKRAEATYLPEGYYAEDGAVSSLYADIFYYDSAGDMKFKLMQTVLGKTDDDDLMIDNEQDPVNTIHINGYEGLLVEYSDSPGLYYLVWQDESYGYALYGSFESKTELIRIAEGVTTK